MPKVLDFGVSKVAVADDENRLTAVATVLGTPHYMSPEQACGDDDVEGASDQFSLAMVLFEAITGQLPYKSDTTLRLIHEVSRANIPLPSEVMAELQPADEMIRRATAREPKERYASIEAFGVALLPLGSERARSEWSEALRNPPEVTTAVPKARKVARAPDTSAPVTMASKGKSGARAIEARTMAAKPASGARQLSPTPEPVVVSDVVSPPEQAPTRAGSRAPLFVGAAALLALLVLGGWWLTGGSAPGEPDMPQSAAAELGAPAHEGAASEASLDAVEELGGIEPGVEASAAEPAAAASTDEDTTIPGDEVLAEPAAATETAPRPTVRPRRPARERPSEPAAGGGEDELRLTR